ncbi:tRNA (guanine-N1)-methyltransferase [Aegicerativicinus sediminis]|uniref:tRNA (guanine-N1)-methyltransferase n=1 Tax=Aegicerativicinus sediminis TaxID=2893202 RepID=UPI001E3AE44A|nr:tRNA (guanine-N1)-methyltransferase [Aegicerativicinus sediminis]
MRHLKLFLLCSVSALFINFNAQAQKRDTEDEGLSLDGSPIDGQFEYIIKKSNSYKDYKVVKKNMLETLKSHTMDTLNAVRKDLVDTQQKVDEQATEISNLKTDLASTTDNLNKTKEEKDSMALFGIQMSKGGYNVLMWSIIGILFALLLLFIYKFKNSNAVTRQAKIALAETEEEFEEHRRTALEREQKVRRQLQDELNKQKKM